ncbi:hypothetical protein HAX54_027051 [Datura stramonium]|uniref:Uncharacterized protein n=1 Tax=Datura stramonium TaxID=4076 RepID=A0ABS8V2A7_DATST|nr:hypothetical protein [Datura stramonium]
MPSSPSSLSPTENPYLHTLLESSRPFLRGELESIDKDLQIPCRRIALCRRRRIGILRKQFPNNSMARRWEARAMDESVSRMGAIYSLIVRRRVLIEQRKKNGQEGVGLLYKGDEEIELVFPQVFDNCTRVLDAEEQNEARELYWEGVCEGSKRGLDWAEEKLLMSVDKNPFVGEPHVVLGQIYLSKGKFEEAEKEAEKGLRLILEWGSPWDKRMSWEGWVAWTRVLLMKAKEKSWPQHSWGILNLGLVR